tara:strand:+ start:4085 stop:4756 length:672 start_codon:yes stop_codon:yes gene_type:complete
MSKSIVIFGKGPSVSRCSREIIDKYDDIAICNYPVLNDFFYNLIKDREIKYHFANCGTYDKRYNDETNKLLKIKGVYNCNYKSSILPYYNFLTDKKIFKESIRETIEANLKKLNFDFDPSTGTLALYYIINTNIYNNILLVGFDNFKKGDQTYYFKPSEYNNKLNYLLKKNIIKSDGIFNIINCHDPDKTKIFYEYLFSNNSNINFKLITNMDLKDFTNLEII